MPASTVDPGPVPVHDGSTWWWFRVPPLALTRRLASLAARSNARTRPRPPVAANSRPTPRRHVARPGRSSLDRSDQLVTGELPLVDANRVLATVLFTDIVDSTAQLVRLGDRRWLDVLNDHDTAVRSSLARFHGHEVKSTGDGFLATFDRPGQAIHAAVMIVQSLAALGISIRAGLHSGEIELMRHDIGGIAVHIAHRISSVAQPGAVVVSSTVKELVDGSDIAFDDLGSQQLKGVPGSRQLFTVRL
ncbi:MAG TPA: adenylate/guanylate cyclase domain-containing protein [Propionibacteriaceae bacterium]|nr:adenylate/guanylate cyclase domain-containing protein [Propionibacteriaceae bacterium]